MRKLFFITLLLIGAVAINAQIKGTNAIINVQTGLSIRPYNADNSDGNKIVMYSSIEWKCLTWSFENVSGNVYALKNLFTNKTFAPVAPVKAGQTLEQVKYKPEDTAQQWEFIPVGDDKYRIRLKGSELYLTSTDSKSSNSILFLDTQSDSDLQLWRLKKQSPSM